MIRIRFTDDRGRVVQGEGADGARLLDVAQATGQPLEGTCGGDMACATCHVVVAAAWFDRLPPATAEEEGLLDFVTDAVRTSRLACQVHLAPALDGMEVRVPDPE